MGELNAILRRAEDLVSADEVEPSDLAAFAAAVHDVAGGVPRSELPVLMEAFDRVRARAEAERDALRARIDQAGSGRRALKGYGGLRGARTCQRASVRG